MDISVYMDVDPIWFTSAAKTEILEKYIVDYVNKIKATINPNLGDKIIINISNSVDNKNLFKILSKNLINTKVWFCKNRLYVHDMMDNSNRFLFMLGKSSVKKFAIFKAYDYVRPIEISVFGKSNVVTSYVDNSDWSKGDVRSEISKKHLDYFLETI